MSEDHSERLHTLETTVSDIRVRQAEIEALITRNSETVEKIKRDTEEIVALMKGASVAARIVRWITVMVGGYLAGKGLKWW